MGRGEGSGNALDCRLALADDAVHGELQLFADSFAEEVITVLVVSLGFVFGKDHVHGSDQ